MTTACTTPAGALKIAAAQYPLDPVASFADWEKKLRRWVEKGAQTGAQVLLFPEYAALEQAATFGPEIAGNLQQSLEHVAQVAGQRIDVHTALAAEFGVYIIAGSGPVKIRDGVYVNAAQLVTPDGLVGEQHKLMMTPFERDWGITAGTRLGVFQTPIATFAIAICYDIEFPLIARTAATCGADCLLVPSCTERVSGYTRVKTSARARALENTIATVQSSTVGDALWSPAIDQNFGAAGFYVPAEHDLSDTGIVHQGQLNEPGWVCGTLDLARLRALRAGGETRNFEDWNLQPGGGVAPLPVDVVDLCDTGDVEK